MRWNFTGTDYSASRNLVHERIPAGEGISGHLIQQAIDAPGIQRGNDDVRPFTGHFATHAVQSFVAQTEFGASATSYPGTRRVQEKNHVNRNASAAPARRAPHASVIRLCGHQ